MIKINNEHIEIKGPDGDIVCEILSGLCVIYDKCNHDDQVFIIMELMKIMEQWTTGNQKLHLASLYGKMVFKDKEDCN